MLLLLLSIASRQTESGTVSGTNVCRMLGCDICTTAMSRGTQRKGDLTSYFFLFCPSNTLLSHSLTQRRTVLLEEQEYW